MRRDESRYRGKGSLRAELDREGLPRKRSAGFQLEVILALWHRDAGWRSRGCIREYDRVVPTETRCKLRFAFGTMFEPGSIQLACVSTCRETSHLQPAVFTKRSNLSSSLRSLSLPLSLCYRTIHGRGPKIALGYRPASFRRPNIFLWSSNYLLIIVVKHALLSWDYVFVNSILVRVHVDR